MKKLMILAAVAAMGTGAFAACAEPTACVYAYKLTMSGKTVTGVTQKGNTSQCIDPVCWATPASLKVTGYVYGTTQDLNDPDQCVEGCACNDFTAPETVVWDAKAKKQLTDTVAFDTIEVVSKKQNKVQVLASLGDITLAGQGSVKKGAITSVKGNFAGSMAAPVCSTCTYDSTDCSESCTETTAIVGKLCTAETTDSAKAVVFGKWTLKANKAAVKKLTKAYAAETLLPKNVTPAQ